MCTFFLLFFKLTCLNNIRCVSRFKKKKKRNNLLYYVYTIFPLRKELENYTFKCNNRYRVEFFFSVERFLNIPELFLLANNIFDPFFLFSQSTISIYSKKRKPFVSSRYSVSSLPWRSRDKRVPTFVERCRMTWMPQPQPPPLSRTISQYDSRFRSGRICYEFFRLITSGPQSRRTLKKTQADLNASLIL